MCFPLKFLYIAEKSDDADFKVAVSVAKKRLRHAVDRNLTKRRIRESVRHLYPTLDLGHCSLKILIIYCDGSIASQATMDRCVQSGIEKIMQYAETL